MRARRLGCSPRTRCLVVTLRDRLASVGRVPDSVWNQTHRIVVGLAVFSPRLSSEPVGLVSK